MVAVVVVVVAYSYDAVRTSMAQRMVQIDHLQGTGKGGVEMEA